VIFASIVILGSESHRTHEHVIFRSKPKLRYDRPSVSQSVLVSSTHLWPTIRCLISSDSCWCGAPSLTRGRVCRLQLLLAFSSEVILESESRGTQSYFTVSDSKLPQPRGSGLRIYVPQEQGDPVITPSTEFPLCCLLRLAGLRWRYSNPLLRQRQYQSQSYFTTGGLPPISSSWRQAPSGSRAENFFQLNPSVHRPYIASSVTRGWVFSYEYAWPFIKCTYRTYSILLKIIPCAVYTSPLSVQGLQSRSCINYVSYATTAG
jgi:hypothetical protein